MKFANKLIILLLTVVILSGGLTSYFAYTSSISSLEEEISNQLEDDAFHDMEAIDQNLFERQADIKIIAGDKIINSRGSTPQEITERLIDFRNAHKVYSSISFFDTNRIRIADTAGLYLGEQHDLTRYWEDVLGGKVSAADDVRIAEELNVPIIYFASPVKDEKGETFGFVVARMSSAKFNDIIGSHAREEKSYQIDLINQEGILLYSNHNPAGILKTKLDEHLTMVKVEEETKGSMLHSTTVSKEKALMGFAKETGHLDFSGNEWTVLIHAPLEIVFAPAIKLRNRLLSITLTLSILTIFLALYFSRRFTKPLGQLSTATEELEKGNFKARTNIKTKDEFQELGETFNKTISILGKTEQKNKQFEDANEMLDKTKDEINKANVERIRLSTVAAFGKNFFVRNWLLVLIVIAIITLITPTIFTKFRDGHLKRKATTLKLDLKKTNELIKALQKECFIDHKINTDTYHDRVLKYEERIAEIKHSVPILEARLARESFSYWGKIKGLFRRKGKKVVVKKSEIVTKKKTNGWNHNNNKKTKKKVVKKKVKNKKNTKKQKK